MANSLLDFVMALVRDPEAAASYHADPAQAIADAGLDGVNSVDVDNLIPVVSESLSTAMPGGGFDSVTDSNVWSSGAATEAFDAFTAPAFDHVGADDYTIVTDLVSDAGTPIDQPDPLAVPAVFTDTVSDQVAAPQLDELPVDSTIDAVAQSPLFEAGGLESHVPAAFDIFD